MTKKISELTEDTSPANTAQVELNVGGVSRRSTLANILKELIDSAAQGDLLYFNGTTWVRLAAGTSGQFLKTLGAAANPTWDTVNAGGSNSICDGRLTLESGVPLSTTDQTGKTTVYFTPYVGNKIALYDGSSAWNVREFTEISVAVPATTSTPFDVFCYDNSGTPALETVNWTNDTTRATALTRQNGVLVKTGATTRRYLGTGRTTTVSGQTESSVTKRFLWNFYNREVRLLSVAESTSHSYSGAARKWNNSDTNNKIEFVAGDPFVISPTWSAALKAGADGSYAQTHLYLDGTIISTFAQLFNYNVQYLGGASVASSLPAVGYHYCQVYELGDHASSTFAWMRMELVLQG